MGRAPKYQQITEWIQNQIACGKLSNGDRLESEHELSARFQLSRQTVRHALLELEEAGIVSRVKGSGTYIQYGTGSTEPLSQTVTIISTYADSYIFPKLLQVMVRRLSRQATARRSCSRTIGSRRRDGCCVRFCPMAVGIRFWSNRS